MKDSRQHSHDILNLIERLRIMHDLARDKNFESVSKQELELDLKETLKKLQESFEALLQ